MGIFGKQYSLIKKTPNGKVLVKFDERDLNKNNEYILPKDIVKIDESAFEETVVKKVVVNERCEHIADKAFQGCQLLKEIVLPSKKIEFGSEVFNNCYTLRSINIPEGLEIIKTGMFKNCKSLEQIKIPSTVKKIETQAFFYCGMLQELKLPENLEEFDTSAVRSCHSLTELKIPSKVKKIGKLVGLNSLKRLVIDANVTEITGIIKGRESLEEVILPPTLEVIGNSSFSGCINLKNVVLPENLQKIENSAFEDCWSLTKINIPNNVTEIGEEAFYNCKNLKEVTLGHGVKTIGAFAFSDCASIEQVILPSSLVKIGEEAFTRTSIKKIEIPESVEFMEKAFYDCKDLESVNINARIERLGTNCFMNCNKLQSVTLPSTLKVIDISAFRNTIIEEINIPDSVNEIEDNAFRNCQALSSVKFSKNLQKIGASAFYNCFMLKSAILPDSLTEIADRAFEGSGIQEVKLPSTLKVIGESAFRESYIEKVEIPSTIKDIKGSSFMYCAKLESVKLHEGLENVFEGAFSYTSITEIEFPSSVKVIKRCLAGCKCLKTATINSAASVAEDLFEFATSLKILNLPNGIAKGETLNLHNCVSLEVINYKGKPIEVTQAVRNNFHDGIAFLEYALDNDKFIPKNGFILKRTNEHEIENYYAHTKDWQSLYKAYTSKYGSENYKLGDGLAMYELAHGLEALYQASIMLGLFQNGEAGKKAKKFIEENILELKPTELHELFGGLDTKSFGFNEEFAKFFIQNYKKPYEEDNMRKYFMHKYESTAWGWCRGVNYIASAYHGWAKVKEIYPNKTVLAHREQGSENNNLTFQDIIHALDTVVYLNVKEGNEKLAELAGKYGYSQEGFEALQNIFERGKKVKDEVILVATEDQEQKGVRYNLLKKDDPRGLVLGPITNCCQELYNVGEACMIYGATAKNSGFVEFTIENQTVGQSWVWYNEKTKQVCLDNIEIPTIWKKEISTEKGSKSFTDCLLRLASSLKQEMEKNGHEVKEVAVGAGYNDLAALTIFEKREVDQKVLPEDYSRYSDATCAQYVIPIKEIKKEANAKDGAER